MAQKRPLFFVYYQGPGMNQKMEDVVKKVKQQIEDYDAKLWPLQIKLSAEGSYQR